MTKVYGIRQKPNSQIDFEFADELYANFCDDFAVIDNTDRTDCTELLVRILQYIRNGNNYEKDN